MDKHGLKPLARVVGYGGHAQAPEWFTTAPVGAIQRTLQRLDLKVDDIDLWEINEAFSVVSMACMQKASVPHDRLNVWGGAVALGHPIGCSGARILVTLLHALEDRSAKRGVGDIVHWRWRGRRRRGGASLNDLAPGVRPISSLLEERPQRGLGEEATDLVRLREQHVAVADGLLVRVSGDAFDTRLRSALDRVQEQGDDFVVRPLLPSRVSRKGMISTPQLESLSPEALTAALHLADTKGLHLLVAPIDRDVRGFAASPNPDRGDPEELSVWATDDAQAVWRIDRRSTRVSEPGQGLSVAQAEQAADLVDRVQLALGRPVEIEWALQKRRFVVLAVRSLDFRPRFVEGSWSRLALVEADEGTVAPLAIDTLDRALGASDRGPKTDQAVRRFYARPYRRHETSPQPLGRVEAASMAEAVTAAGRVAASVAPLLADALRFEREFEHRVDVLREVDLKLLPDGGLLEQIAERQRLGAEALLILDRSRGATRRLLLALEVVIGPLPRGSYPALAAPRSVRHRRRVNERVVRFAEKIASHHGEVVGRDQLGESHRRRWDELKRDLADIRPLGIDVMPLPIGHDDATMLRALRRAPTYGHAARERTRKDAATRVLNTARSRALGRPRAALASSLLVLLGRVARSKGGISEGVAVALMALRNATVELGSRLVERAILDEPEDALYLNRAELEEALRGEPGAYAARVRLRREDDLRWSNFDAPRRLGGG